MKLDQQLDQHTISNLIPHGESMCLLDGTEAWDATHIICVSRKHLQPSHPLRFDNQLPCITGIECAGQAIALHTYLINMSADDTAPRRGFFAKLNNVNLSRERLDDLGQEIIIQCDLQMQQEDGAIYDFKLSCAAQLILSASAIVMLALNTDELS